MDRNISIVVRCSDNFAVFDCIKSIDYPAEVIVSMTPNLKLKKAIKKIPGIKSLTVPYGNSAITSNRGIKCSKNNKVLIVDCDITFSPGTIKKVVEALEKYSVVKTRIIYKNNGGLLSRVVAGCRDYFNCNATAAFVPGLGFKKEKIKKSLGYFFDETLTWGEDSDFSARLKGINIHLKYLHDAMIQHPHISMKHDLADAYLIGTHKSNPKRIWKAIINNNFKEIMRGWGIGTLAYYILWRIFYYFGYFSQNLRWMKNLEPSIWRMLGQP